MNVKFKYESFLRCALFALGLLEKAKTRTVVLCITLDTTDICKSTKRCHILAGFKIVNCGTKFGTNELMFQCNAGNSKYGEDKSEFHKNKLITFVSLNFCVGKESLEDSRNDFKFFLNLYRG